MTPAQCRAARAMLGWSQQHLCEQAKVARKTLADFEGGKSTPYARTLEDIQEALEAGGIIFLASGESADGGPGLRLRRGEVTL